MLVYHLSLSIGFFLQLIGSMVGEPDVLAIVVVTMVAFVLITPNVLVLVVPAKPTLGIIENQEDPPGPIDESYRTV